MTTGRIVAATLATIVSAGICAAATLPRHAPDFVVHTADGKQIPLSRYSGKAVVLAFILTTCPHCQHTIVILSKFQPEYAARGVQMLAVAIEDAARTNLSGFIGRFKPPFPVGFSTRKPVYDFLQHPPVTGLRMPGLVFIDRDGNIQAQYEGESPFFNNDDQEKNIRSEIEKLLKEGLGAGKSGPIKTRAAQKK
jgi:peroxiredoxin